MRILIAGCSGFLGRYLEKHLSRQHEVYGVSRSCNPDHHHIPGDLSDPAFVEMLSRDIGGDIVIHAAGIKDIIRCETEPELGFRENTRTTANLCQYFGAPTRILYVSSDYVFEGTKGRYAETDPAHPKTRYGQSKLDAEAEGMRLSGNHFSIMRTAAIYSHDAAFPRFLQKQLTEGNKVECFLDSTYSPTYIDDFLAAVTFWCGHPEVHGVFHVCGSPCTRCEFARMFARASGFSEDLIEPVNGGMSRYLFPDLSLSSVLTMRAFSMTPTPHEQALSSIAKGEYGD